MNDLLILGSSATALVPIRVFSKRTDFRNIYIIDNNNGCAAVSNKIHRFEKCNFHLDSFDIIIKDLLQSKHAFTPLKVIVTSDEWQDFIYQNTKSLCAYTSIDWYWMFNENYSLLADKFKFKGVARSLGLLVPEDAVFENGILVKGDFNNLCYPLFVKPANRSGLKEYMQGKKGWLVEDKFELQRVVALPFLAKKSLLAEEVIKGNDDKIVVLAGYSNGKSSIVWTGKKLSQSPKGFGSADYLTGGKCDILNDAAKMFIDRTGYKGFFSIEAKYEERRNDLFFIEVNTRISLWWGILIEMEEFWDNVLTLCTEQDDSSIEVRELNYENKSWVYFYKFIFSNVRNREWKILLHYIRRFRSCTYAVLDFEDMLPWFHDIKRAIIKLSRR